MVDADRFVSGTDVDIRLLVSTLIGGVAISWWAGFVSLLDETMSFLGRLWTSPLAAVGELLELILALPGETIIVAWRSAAEFIAVLEPLGPILYPIAMIVTIATLYISDWGLRQMGVV